MHRAPAPIHRVSSWSTIKRLYDTGSLRTPSRLAHQTRPIRQYWTVLTLSRLLPPSPAFPGARLPPASPNRYDGQAMQVFHLHPIQQRLVAHHVLVNADHLHAVEP